jgi:argininosuccinate lyase
VISLLSAGKALFMGYNRDTQWTKYWIMDLIEESKPALSVMADVIRLLQANQAQMLKQAQEQFAGATALMEWLVSHRSLPLRKAKLVMEKAVKYSERDGKGEVSYPGLKRALQESKIGLRVTENDVKKIQRPERILAQLQSIGTPSEKRIREDLSSLQRKMKIDRKWLIQIRRRIEKSRELASGMERALGG